LHLELKPKWAQHKKGKNKTKAIVLDLGSNFDDEIKVTAMGIKGIFFVVDSTSVASSSKDNVFPDERKRN
jgi:hypothetical protein